MTMLKTNFMPLSSRKIPRFAGIKTFFRLPIINLDFEDSKELDVAIFGLPFDGAVSYRSGARFGPSKIRELSSLVRGYHLSRGESLFSEINVADIGDCSVVPMSVEKTYELIEAFDQKILEKKKRFLSIGGDHSTTLAHLRALSHFYGTPLSLVHFDAHLDTYPSAWGCEFHHGAFVRHAVNEGLIDPKSSLQIGIRGPLVGRDDLDFNHKHSLRYTTVDDVRKQGVFEFCKSLPEFNSDLCFISFDIDCLDPSYAPGTGTPVPGGLTTYEVQKILQALKIKNLVGGDLVEVSPPYDQSDITALAGVDVCFEILCLLKKNLLKKDQKDLLKRISLKRISLKRIFLKRIFLKRISLKRISLKRISLKRISLKNNNKNSKNSYLFTPSEDHNELSPDQVLDKVKNGFPKDWKNLFKKSMDMGSYLRFRLYKDSKIEIVLCLWKPQKGSDLHFHPGKDCWFETLEGDDMSEFRKQTGKTIKLAVGDRNYIFDGHGPHQMFNNSNEASYSLHYYKKRND